MNKHYILFIISIITLFFIIGCPPKKLEANTAENIKQNQLQSQITEPEKIKTPKIKIETTEHLKPESEKIEPRKTEPEKIQTD